MRLVLFLATFVLATGIAAQTPISTAPPPSLSLQDAQRIAETNNPKLHIARAGVIAAEARLAETSGALWNNPELVGEAGPRRTRQPGLPSEHSTDIEIGIAQTFEIAGQQGYRRQSASDELTLAKQNAEEALRELRFDVERRFMQVIGLQHTLTAEQESLRLIENAAENAAKRLAAGEDTRLDANVARVEAARARNQLAVLSEQLAQSRFELAETLQLPPHAVPEVSGELDAAPRSYRLDDLLASAASRPQLLAKQAREDAARNRLALERAARNPDVTVGLRLVREGVPETQDRIARLTISVPLPLFRHNEGNIGQATSDLLTAQVERQSAERDVEASVRSLWRKLGDVRARVETLRAAILPALEENQRLSQRALQEGEISLVQLILVNRQRVEARRDLINAMTELSQTRIALEQAAGWIAKQDR